MDREIKIKKLKLELNALLEVPVYCSHRNGKNWLAKIELDPASPGGLKREFAKKGGGDYYYILPEDWKEGTPLEFGGDYISWSGKTRYKRRFYCFILERTDDFLIIAECSSARKAIQNIPDENKVCDTNISLN